MREEGLEPSRLAARDPKSRASANSATLANRSRAAPIDLKLRRLRHDTIGPRSIASGSPKRSRDRRFVSKLM